VKEIKDGFIRNENKENIMISREERKRIIQQMRFNSSLILRLQAMNAVHKMRLGIPPFDAKATKEPASVFAEATTDKSEGRQGEGD